MFNGYVYVYVSLPSFNSVLSNAVFDLISASVKRTVSPQTKQVIDRPQTVVVACKTSYKTLITTTKLYCKDVKAADLQNILENY